MNEELILLYREIADLTRPKCGACPSPYYCCTEDQCEATIRYASELGVLLSTTDHPNIPLLNRDNTCSVAPHLRPICSVHVCDQHLWDEQFAAQYWALRDRINELECENHPLIRA